MITTKTEIILFNGSTTFRLRNLVINNGGNIKMVDSVSIIALCYVDIVQKFTHDNDIHRIYKLIDNTMIETVHKSENDSYAYSVSTV